MKRATRLTNTPPYPFVRWASLIAAARQQGLDVIRLDVGNPDLPPPDDVVEALCQSAYCPDRHGYPGYKGLPALRQAIADYYERRFGVLLDPETQVVPLIGSKEGIVNLALACLDPGDLVLVPDPGYAPYARGAALASAEIHTFPLLAERGFLPDLDAIPAGVADRAVLMWLNYPNFDQLRRVCYHCLGQRRIGAETKRIGGEIECTDVDGRFCPPRRRCHHRHRRQRLRRRQAARRPLPRHPGRFPQPLRRDTRWGDASTLVPK